MKDEILFGKGIENPYGEFFVGQSYLNIINEEGVFIGNVTFEPACRNNWHIHHAKSGGGQILLATHGEGWYQEEGKMHRNCCQEVVSTFHPELNIGMEQQKTVNLHI